MANGQQQRQLSDFVDFNQLANTALRLEQIRGQRSRNSLTEMSLGLQAAKIQESRSSRDLVRQRLEFDQQKSKMEVLNKFMSNPATTMENRFKAGEQLFTLAGLEKPSEDDFMAASDLAADFMKAYLQDPNSRQTSEAMESFALAAPDFFEKQMKNLEQFGKVSLEAEKIRANIGVNRERLKEIQSRTATLNAKRRLLARQDEDLRIISRFREPLLAQKLEKGADEGKLFDIKIRQLSREDDVLNRFFLEAPSKAIETNSQLLDLSQREAQVEQILQLNDSGQPLPQGMNRRVLEGELKAIPFLRDELQAKGDFFRNATVPGQGSRFFKLWIQASDARQRELGKANSEATRLSQEKVDLSRGRLVLQQGKEERDRLQERAENIAQAEFARLGEAQRTPQAAGRIAESIAQRAEFRTFGIVPATDKILEAARVKGRISIGLDIRQPTRSTVTAIQKELLAIPTTISTVDRVLEVTTPENIGAVGSVKLALEGMADQISALGNATMARASADGVDPEKLSFRLFDVTEVGAFQALSNSLAYEVLASRQSAQSISNRDIERILKDEFGFGKTFPSAPDLQNRLRILKDRLQERQSFLQQALRDPLFTGPGQVQGDNPLIGLSKQQLLDILTGQER